MIVHARHAVPLLHCGPAFAGRRPSMTSGSWLRNLFAFRTPRSVRKAPARFRPCLEGLENRMMLSSNLPPTITSISVPAIGTEGSIVNLSATATDPDGDPLSYYWFITWPSGTTHTGLGGASW